MFQDNIQDDNSQGHMVSRRLHQALVRTRVLEDVLDFIMIQFYTQESFKQIYELSSFSPDLNSSNVRELIIS